MHCVHLPRRHGDALPVQREVDEVARAMADAVAQARTAVGGETVPGQDRIQRRQEIRSAIDESPVEIEDEERSRHAPK